MAQQPFSVVFIANSGRSDEPLPDYLQEALRRFAQEEKKPRYCLIAHDVEGGGSSVFSKTLGMSGTGKSTQGSLLNMLARYNPGIY